jgi:hypothetical protein
MAEPLLPWGSPGPHPDLLWRGRLVGRFYAEVQRTGPRTGKICVFDQADNDKEVVCWEMDLLYGPQFKPDVSEINEWKQRIARFIDNYVCKL